MRAAKEYFGGTNGEEHASDPGGEEEVDTDRMGVLAPDSLEVEERFEGVGDGDGEKEGEGKEPDDQVYVGGYVEERGGGGGGERVPEDGLAAEAERDSEGVDGKAEEERPLLVFWEEDVFRILHDKHTFSVKECFLFAKN